MSEFQQPTLRHQAGRGNARWFRGICSLVLLLVAPASVGAQNFDCRDADIRDLAEAERVRRAVYWTGRELPGHWSRRCPIVVEDAGREPVAASGRTTFTIAGGEVFQWRMSVRGRREELLRDVIPHEVDHMVRASLVRRPLPRWLDEGCASLAESAESHERLRRTIEATPAFPLTSSDLNDLALPDSSKAARIYAGGFSLVEFLLERDGPETLLALQQEDRPIENGLQRLYGLSVSQLDHAWRTWRVERTRRGTTCASVGCTLHGGETSHDLVCDCRTPPANLLTIYSATWCGPCRRFWNDFRRDVTFRAALTEKFHIHTVDADRDPFAITRDQVRSLPTFVHAGGRVEGYDGPEWLLSRLGGSASSQAGAEVDPATTPPSLPSKAVPGIHAAPPPPARSEQPVVEAVARVAPIVLTALQWTGVIGGTLATGGLGGIGLTLLLGWLRRRKSQTAEAVGKEAGPPLAAPFPRELDEARELLGLRQSEGRVAALDALRGMFLDDEVGKVMEQGDAAAKAAVQQLMTAISARVDSVAPLATSVAADDVPTA